MQMECYSGNWVNSLAGNPSPNLEGLVGFLIFFLGDPGDGRGVGPVFDGPEEKVEHPVWFLLPWSCLGPHRDYEFGMELRGDRRSFNPITDLNQKSNEMSIFYGGSCQKQVEPGNGEKYQVQSRQRSEATSITLGAFNLYGFQVKPPFQYPPRRAPRPGDTRQTG